MDGPETARLAWRRIRILLLPAPGGRCGYIRSGSTSACSGEMKATRTPSKGALGAVPTLWNRSASARFAVGHPPDFRSIDIRPGKPQKPKYLDAAGELEYRENRK